MRVEPWQIPVLVMAGVIMLEFVVHVIRLRRRSPIVEKQVRTVALGLLAALLLVIFVWAVGTDTASALASVASAVTDVVALWLAYQSYQELKAAQSQQRPLRGNSPSERRDSRRDART